MDEVCSKAEFASRLGVTRGRVSQWLATRRIDGEAIVGEGRSARIDVKLARQQLADRLDIGQRLGANGRVRLALPDPTEAAIKAQRLRALELGNAKLTADANALSGRYMLAGEVRQQYGNIASRLTATFEASFMPMANAIVASRAQTQRDVLRVMRSAWREARLQAAKAQGDEALSLPSVIDERNAAVEP
jgi:hypothetical protein